LGENGVGKTILLQAITLALKGEKDFRIDSSFKIGGVAFEGAANPFYVNTFAYGVGRLRTHDTESDVTGHGTLFDPGASLGNPILWLKEVERLNLKGLSPLKLETVFDLLNDVLQIKIDGKPTNSVRIETDDKTGDIFFTENNAKVDFAHLADGYRSVFILLADLLRRMIQNQGFQTMTDFKGVVLVDEIDMLLHPKWEFSLVRKLREKFPNIQWFFSTHSPVLIQGASKDAVFYRIERSATNIRLSEPWTADDLAHLPTNGLLTSPLFDMPSARMSMLSDADTVDASENFWYGRIHEKIKQKIQQDKLNGKLVLDNTKPLSSCPFNPMEQAQ